MFFKRDDKKPIKWKPRLVKSDSNMKSSFSHKEHQDVLTNDCLFDKWLLMLSEKIGLPPVEFTLSADDIRYINKNSHTQKGLQYLISMIFQHLNMKAFHCEVKYTIGHQNSRKAFIVDGNGNVAKYTDNDGKAGQYSFLHGMPCITLNIEEYYPIDTIIAIACHECMHHFLRIKKIEFIDTVQNERLTDIAAVYMGFGTYMQKGYSPITISCGDNKEKIITVGYITAQEIGSTIRKLKSVSIKYIEEQNRKQAISRLLEISQARVKVFHEVYERYNYCLATVMQNADANLSAEDFSSLQNWIIYADDDSKLETKLQRNLQNIKTKEGAEAFSVEVDKICTDLTQRTVILAKYI